MFTLTIRLWEELGTRNRCAIAKRCKKTVSVPIGCFPFMWYIISSKLFSAESMEHIPYQAIAHNMKLLPQNESQKHTCWCCITGFLMVIVSHHAGDCRDSRPVCIFSRTGLCDHRRMLPGYQSHVHINYLSIYIFLDGLGLKLSRLLPFWRQKTQELTFWSSSYFMNVPDSEP